MIVIGAAVVSVLIAVIGVLAIRYSSMVVDYVANLSPGFPQWFTRWWTILGGVVFLIVGIMSLYKTLVR